MKIGFIGAGSVARKYSQYFVKHGHQVVLSNSRGGSSLSDLVQSLGPNAKAGTVIDAANQEIVILAARWEHAQKALAGVSDWKGRILVDATNNAANDQTKGKAASEVIASYAPGARVVKALNTLVVNWMPDASEEKEKQVLFISGDDLEAKRRVAALLDSSGFASVDIGGLVESGKLTDFGRPLSGLHVNLVKRMKS